MLLLDAIVHVGVKVTEEVGGEGGGGLEENAQYL